LLKATREDREEKSANRVEKKLLVLFQNFNLIQEENTTNREEACKKGGATQEIARRETKKEEQKDRAKKAEIKTS
jgi:hypothetical protein